MKMRSIHTSCCFLAFVGLYFSAVVSSAGGILDEQDDSGNPVEEVAASHIPEFISKPQMIYANEKDTVTMECKVEKLDPYVLMWKKGEDLLRINTQVMTNNYRYSFKDYVFTINDLKPEDEGEYTCQISAITKEPLMLVNVVRIKAAPKIHAQPQESDIKVTEGDVLSLRCQAEGQPPPNITWFNEEMTLRPTSGMLKDNNETLEFSNIQGSDAGQFECVANNGVGHEAKKVFRVKVKHPPKVKLDKFYLQSAGVPHLEVACAVKADPTAEIHWYKDGKVIKNSDHVNIKTKENHSTVRISNVKESDFGTYRCEAKNEMGSTKAEVPFAGTPNRVQFVSKPVGPKEDSYILEYTSESMSSIIDYRLLIRKATSGKAESDDWKEVVIPAGAHSSPRYKAKYEIRGLQPAGVYDVYMTARNKYGSSTESEPFRFTTLGGSLGDQRVMDDKGSSATPETVKELKSMPTERNGSPQHDQRAKIVAVMTVIILIAFF